MAFAAGLSVVERAEAARDLLYVIEDRQICLVSCLIGEAIAQVVKTRRRFSYRR